MEEFKSKRKYLSCNIGDKFNRLTILEIFQDNKKVWKVKVLCDCGNINISKRHSVIIGTSKSCGCFRVEHSRMLLSKNITYERKPKEYAGITHAIKDVEKAAKKRGIEYNLTREEASYIMRQNCIYCNQEPNQMAIYSKPGLYRGRTQDGLNNAQFIHNGIDRVDNTKGYNLENCAPCCGKCNIMKRTYSITEWFEHMQKILNNKDVILSKLNMDVK